MTCGSKRTPRRLAETEPSGRGAEAGGPAPREPHPGGNLSETGAKDGPRDTAGPAGCLCCDGTNCYMCCSTLGQVVVWGHLLTLGSPHLFLFLGPLGRSVHSSSNPEVEPLTRCGEEVEGAPTGMELHCPAAALLDHSRLSGFTSHRAGSTQANKAQTWASSLPPLGQYVTAAGVQEDSPVTFFPTK